MVKEIWRVWLEDKNKREQDFERFLKNNRIKKETETKNLVKGHLEKAEHNLKFVNSSLDLKEFNDWVVVGVYYAIYHASLALCALRGYSTKNHLATLLILIKEFYQDKLNKEEIEIIREIEVKKEELLYYVTAKKERQKASYSTKINFDEDKVRRLRENAISFVNKTKEIIDSTF